MFFALHVAVQGGLVSCEYLTGFTPMKKITKLKLNNKYLSWSSRPNPEEHGVSQRDKFNYQLDLIGNALTSSAVLLGDLKP